MDMYTIRALYLGNTYSIVIKSIRGSWIRRVAMDQLSFVFEKDVYALREN